MAFQTLDDLLKASNLVTSLFVLISMFPLMKKETLLTRVALTLLFPPSRLWWKAALRSFCPRTLAAPRER